LFITRAPGGNLKGVLYQTVDYKLLDFSTNLLACCYAFLNFLRPLWIKVIRSRKELEEEARATLHSNATAKIEGCKQKMLLLRFEDDKDSDY
jgi:hypothetical protein